MTRQIDLLDDPGAVGQRAQKRPAVGLGHDAGIEDHHDAPVGLGPDQPAEALLELDHGFGNLILDERIAAPVADVLEPGLQQEGGWER